MDIDGVCTLVAAVAHVDEGNASRDELDVAADQVRRLLSWVQAQQIRITQGLTRVAAFPEDAVARGSRVSLGQAGRLVERAETAAEAPKLTAAIESGHVAGEHMDALTRVMREVQPDERPALVARAEELVAVAAAQTPQEWTRRLRTEARRLSTDDGTARFEQQCRATRLTTMLDPVSGMWRMTGVFDPLTGNKLQRVLDAAVNRLFHDATPPTCPTDPIARQDHLRALALADLLTRGGGTLSTPEAILVLQATEQGEVVVDLGGELEVPQSVLRDLVRRAAMFPVLVRNGDVVWAPGKMNLGRSQRLASADQRRALRALYRGCAVPGCEVGFHRTKIHHIVEWEDFGLTDLDNLIPLCPHHHTLVHSGAWRLRLDPGRVLVIDLPDGTRLRGPPSRMAA